jgi:hypothetical protein
MTVPTTREAVIAIVLDAPYPAGLLHDTVVEEVQLLVAHASAA